MVICFIVISAILALLKWQYGLYDLMDLAIFSQSVSHFSLYNSIQGSSYFADHFSPLIYVISLLYHIVPHPLTLVFVQILAQASTVIPLKRIFPHKTWLIFAFLFNPITINISLYEFEMLPFIIPLFFWAYLFYIQKEWKLFLCFLFLGLLVREDTFLLLLGFPILAWIQKKGKEWIYLPVLLIGVYTVLAFSIISFLNPDGYKFWLLYPSFSPFLLLRVEVLAMVLGVMMPFFFLPFTKPAYLVFCMLPFLQLALTASGGGNMAIQSHYGSMMLCGVILSLGYAKITKLSGFLLIICVLYTSFSLTPIIPLLSYPSSDDPIFSILQKTPPESFVLSSSRYLPYIRSSHVYAQNYAYLGVKQYSPTAYDIPSLDLMIIDTQELLGLRYQHPALYEPYLTDGVSRLQTLIQHNQLHLMWYQDSVLVFGRGEVIPVPSQILPWNDLSKDMVIQTKDKTLVLPPDYALLFNASPIRIRTNPILSTTQKKTAGSVILSPALSSQIITE